jgi:hypothetical protein
MIGKFELSLWAEFDGWEEFIKFAGDRLLAFACRHGSMA